MLGVPLVLGGGLVGLILVNNRARARALDSAAPRSDDGGDRGDRGAAPPPPAEDP